MCARNVDGKESRRPRGAEQHARHDAPWALEQLRPVHRNRRRDIHGQVHHERAGEEERQDADDVAVAVVGVGGM